jgi:hypothetical protein
VNQYDLEILQTITAVSPEPARLGVTATSGGSRAITGIQKLVQRYSSVLLTELGSVGFDSLFGTGLVPGLSQGVSRSAAGVSNAFNFASADAVDILKAEDSDPSYGETPDDERIASATLLDFSVDTSIGAVYLEVQLESAAGTAYTYKMPVSILRS